MSQFGEAIAAVFGDDEPVQDPDKTGIKIRIALFYDGTLNNRNNIERREKTEAGKGKPEPAPMYDQKGKKIKTDSEIYNENRDASGPNSYDNGRTNIAIMEAQVPQILSKEGEYDFWLKFYIEGQGTFNDKGDSLMGYSMGALSSGVPRRAKKGIQEAVTGIKTVLNDEEMFPEKYFIELLTVDVFGFSRGAATARQSIHQMVKSTLRPLYTRLRGIGYLDTKKSAVKVCFAGLYDTVLSYWAGQYLHTEWLLDMKSVTEAEKVIHLAAADEHRIDFPVSNIKSAKSKGNGEEYFLPGVHSDVGGSYNMALDLSLQKEVPDDQKEYMRTSDEGAEKPSEKGRIINKGDPDLLETDRQKLIELGWYLPHEIEITDITPAVPPRAGRNGMEPGRPARGVLVVNRKNIRSGYSNIPLKIMAEFARKEGVKIDTELEAVANKILSIETDLTELEKKVKSYVSSTKESKPEDWLSDPALKTIRHTHFHFSSKVGTGYNPRFGKDKVTRTRYIVDA